MSPSSTRERDRKRRLDGSRTNVWIVVGALAVAAAIIVAVVLVNRDEPPQTMPAHIQTFGLADDPSLGSDDAPVVLVGYESPHCSSCKAFHNNQLPNIRTTYIDTGQVRYHYIQGTVGGDLASNIAQECVYEHAGNDAFWSLTDLLYARSNTYTTPDWDPILADVEADQGLATGTLTTCLDEEATESKVSEDWRIGRERGAQGTPTFWVFGPEGAAQQGRAGDVTRLLDEALEDAA